MTRTNSFDPSVRDGIGFFLLISGLVVVFGPALFLSGVSHPSAQLTTFGLLIGAGVGGLIVACGVALMWGKTRYASYGFTILGIEYIVIEFHDGYGGGIPLFFVTGLVFLVAGYWYWNNDS